MNWLGDEALDSRGRPVFAKIRSTRPPVEAEIMSSPEGAMISIAQGEYGVSPGQACVFYEKPGPNARVLGGGFISRSFPVRFPQKSNNLSAEETSKNMELEPF